MAPNWWNQQGSWNHGHGQSRGHWNGQDSQGMWQCQDIDCKKVQPAKGAVWNLSRHQRCRCCDEPRAVAKQELSMEQRQTLKGAIAARKAKASDGSDAADTAPKPPRKGKKSRKAKRNKEELTVVGDDDDGMEAQAEDEVVETALPPVLAKQEEAKKQRLAWLGLPLLSGNVVTKLYPLAGPTVKGTPAEAAARALSGQASEAVASLQKEVADLHTLAGMCSRTSGEKSAVFLAAKVDLDAKDAALRKLLKATPAACSKTTVERLRKVRKDTAEEHAERDLRATAGREKALVRYAADQESLDLAIAELTQRKAMHAAAFLASQTSFAEYDTARCEQDKAVLAILDAKITQATPLGGASAAAAGQAPTALVPAVQPEYADLELRAEVQPWDLPVIDAIKAEEKEQLDAMWSFFLAVPPGTAMPPITYKALGVTKMETVANLLGSTAMGRVYGGRTIYTSAFVPWNVLELLRYAMTQAHSMLSEIKEQQQAILDRLQAARDAAKTNGYSRGGNF